MIRIDYSLSLPQQIPVSEIMEKFGKVRQRCLDLPFSHVSPVFVFVDLAWLNQEELVNAVRPNRSIGFHLDFGFAGKIWLAVNGFPEAGRAPRYFYRAGSFSQKGAMPVEEFARRHRAVCEALKSCASQGFKVEVKDESGFWETENFTELMRYKELQERYKDPRESMVR